MGKWTNFSRQEEKRPALKKRGMQHSITNSIYLATYSYYPVVNIPQEMPVTVFLKRGKSFLFMASI